MLHAHSWVLPDRSQGSPARRRRRRSSTRPATAVPPLLHIRRSTVVAVGHRRRKISTPHHHRRANCTSQPPQLEHSWSAPTGAPPLRPPLARAPWPRSPRPAHLLRAHTSPSRGIGQPKHAHSHRRSRPAAPTGAGRCRIRSPTSPATTGRRLRRRALSRGPAAVPAQKHRRAREGTPRRLHHEPRGLPTARAGGDAADGGARVGAAARVCRFARAARAGAARARGRVSCV